MEKLKLESKDGFTAYFNLSDIGSITFEKAKKLLIPGDIARNDLEPKDVLILINFKSGKSSMFSTKEWSMRFD